MDQNNQEQQKKKRPYYNNRKHKNGGNAASHPNGEENANRQAPKQQGGESHPHRNPQAAPNAVNEENKRPRQEARERNENRPNKPTAENREHRDSREGCDNHGNPRNRNTAGRGNNGNRPPRDTAAPKEAKPAEMHSAENRNADAPHGDNRNRRGDRNDRNRPRRNESRPPIEEAPRREKPVKDVEMDSWFAPAPAEPKVDPIFSVPAAAAQEQLPHVELDLSDILPPIAMEKYGEADLPKSAVETGEAEEEAAAEPVASVEVIGIRFNKMGKVYYFDPNGCTARRGDAVIVETARGPEFGEVWLSNHTVKETDIVPPLRPVIRLADEKDVLHNADNARREEEAFRICLDKIKAHGLDMKLVQAQYTFDNSKLLFYFTSAGRVDFRELVKDLASVFRTRIELRQIGIRDEAKLMGGLGICGRPLCCASFLSDFTQVSIKMAKEQNLSLNSAKISGTCGRLMCCLNYEYPVYCEAARHTPGVGSTVSTPDGTGTVTETQPLSGMVKVALANAPAGTVPQYYRCDVVRVINESRRHTGEDSASDEELPSEEK